VVAQASLFDAVSFAPPPPPALRPPARRLSLPEKLRQERDFIGYYLSSHPLDEYRELIRVAQLTSEASLLLNAEVPELRLVRAAALLIDADERRSRQGRPYARLLFEDKAGTYTLTVFSPQWEQVAPKVRGRMGDAFFLEVEYVVRAEGGAEWRLRTIDALQAAADMAFSAIVLEWDLQTVEERQSLEDLAFLVEQQKGHIPVYLLLHYAQAMPVLVQTDWKLRYTPDLAEKFRPLGVRVRTDIPVR
jgi:DNA polymerase-3 subunit alpha